jgi:hypothetical protein
MLGGYKSVTAGARKKRANTITVSNGSMRTNSNGNKLTVYALHKSNTG